MKETQAGVLRWAGWRRVGMAGLLAAVPAAPALAFSFHHGSVEGAFDTDLTYGVQVRTQDADPNKTAASYGNRVLFPDAGDIFSNQIRASHTIQATYGNWGGLLVRGNYLYDNAYEGEDIADDADSRLRFSGLLTDAMLYTTIGPVNLRVGKQVINWGENTFIPGSINDVNTVDVTKLRQPGSELKDAFFGTWGAYAQLPFLENWTAEAFTLFDFDGVRVDAMGSIFATLDAIGPGGGYDDGGDEEIDGACLAPRNGRCDLAGGRLLRTSDREPGGSGQWGFALRHFIPTFGNGGEVAIYAQNLHDHLMMVSTFRASGRYFLDYPEDIKRYGVSFNTNLAGLALSGEYSLREGAPVQLLAPVLRGIVPPPTAPMPADAGAYQRGWAEVDRHQVQLTMQKNFGVVHMLKADAAGLIGEAAYGWAEDVPARSTLFERHVTNSFYGFQVRGNLTYQAALFNLVAVSPLFAYRWDIDGYSNELGGAKVFVEDRQSATVGLDFDYQAGKYKSNLSYTSFFGDDDLANAVGGIYNGVTDRDYVQLSFSMSF